MSGRAALVLVATPIGNLGDLSPRALETLRTVDAICAEDTRHTRQLLSHFGLERPLRALQGYHEHNAARVRPQVLERLRAGAAVALVSDAGTPLVSDPGYRLVRAAIDEGLPVTSLPGPSAVTTALAASGLPPHPFQFVGFLPRTAAARRTALEALRNDDATLIAFEAPRRIIAAVRDALSVLGDRPACLARNLTKPHERYQRGPLSALLAEIEAEDEVRGECTLLIGGAVDRPGPGADAESDAELLLQADAPARAVQELLIRRHGLSKRDAYALVLRIRNR